MIYALVVGSAAHGELVFPYYAANEFLAAATVARETSRHTQWAEVRDIASGFVSVRYEQGKPRGMEEFLRPSWAETLAHGVDLAAIYQDC